MEDIDISCGSSVEAFNKFSEWVDQFCINNNIPKQSINDEQRGQYDKILNLKTEELLSLSPQECMIYAITLMNYASVLQKQLDIINSQYHWCNEALNYLYSKYWEQYDKFLPAEIRKKSIVAENSYALSVEKTRIKLYAGITVLSDSCKDLKKKVILFQELGKIKGYES